MNDNEPRLSEGQKAAGKEAERRNRENETGQADEQQDFQRQAGQAIERSETDASGEDAADPIVATSGDTSSDYLTKGEEEETDFAEQGQGAPEPSAGRSDIEQPSADTPDAVLDEGSSAKP